MEDVDTQDLPEIDDYADEHEVFMHHVAQGEHELLFLDSYLAESFRKHEHSNNYELGIRN